MVEIRTIDLHYQGVSQSIAAYVVMAPDGPILIETGPASTFQNLLDGLNGLGLKLSDIRHALVTHIHLDHAGAAGHLAQHGVHIHVHEFGVRHLVDPSKLISSARRIYGTQLEKLWGSVIPVPETQITAVHDSDELQLNGLSIKTIETPGHARHHHAFAVDTDNGRICIAGDSAGMIVPGIPEPPEGNYLVVPTPPPEFDLEAWLASIRRLESHEFSVIYPTHFGPRHHVREHFARLRTLLQEHVRFVQSALNTDQSRQKIVDRYKAWNCDQAGIDGIQSGQLLKYATFNLLSMSVDGIIRYLSKRTQVVP